MKRTLIKVLVFLLILVVAIFIFVFLFHRIKLWQEAKQYLPIGKIVEVNDHKIHIYSEGEGKDTLVFLAGWSTSSPVWDFKALYSQFSDKYHIVVIERPGYGYSESSNNPRDIDTVMEESRSALKLSEESGPYILFPHSVSGLEAIYWAQKHPEEIKAIVGLDISFPETYANLDEELMNTSMKQLKTDSLVKNFGFIRFVPNFFEYHEPIMFNYLTAEEKEAYKSVVYRSYYTKDMLNEGYEVLSNAKKVGAVDAPVKTPTFLFIATEQGEEHTELSLKYLSQINNGGYRILDCGHYLHDFMPEEIAETSFKFIDSLEN